MISDLDESEKKCQRSVAGGNMMSATRFRSLTVLERCHIVYHQSSCKE